jgi:hypothetical protein
MADHAIGCAGSPGAGNSIARVRRDQPNVAHTLEVSLFGSLGGGEIIERPFIVRLGGFGLASDDDDGAIGADFVARDFERGLACYADRPARNALRHTSTPRRSRAKSSQARRNAQWLMRISAHN